MRRSGARAKWAASSSAFTTRTRTTRRSRHSTIWTTRGRLLVCNRFRPRRRLSRYDIVASARGPLCVSTRKISAADLCLTPFTFRRRFVPSPTSKSRSTSTAAPSASCSPTSRRSYEGLRKHLYAEDGRLRNFVNIYLNDEDIRYLQREKTPVKPGDSLSIVPSVAGGAPTAPADRVGAGLQTRRRHRPWISPPTRSSATRGISSCRRSASTDRRS